MSGIPYEARYSKSQMFMLVALAGAILAAGLWAVGAFGPPLHPERAWAGWIVIVFGGLFGLICIRRLFDRDVQLRISSEGIQYKQWSPATVPWGEISEVGEWSYRGQRSILLNLHHPDRYPSTRVLGRFAKANRILTGSDIPISMTALDCRFDETMKSIEQFRELTMSTSRGIWRRA